jgi:hypothetical protein
VVVVNKRNPLRSISLEQFRAICTCEITSWGQVGADFLQRSDIVVEGQPNFRNAHYITKTRALVPKQAYAGWHESPQGGRGGGARQALSACQAVMCFPWLSLFHAPFSFHNI